MEQGFRTQSKVQACVLVHARTSMYQVIPTCVQRDNTQASASTLPRMERKRRVGAGREEVISLHLYFCSAFTLQAQSYLCLRFRFSFAATSIPPPQVSSCLGLGSSIGTRSQEERATASASFSLLLCYAQVTTVLDTGPCSDQYISSSGIDRFFNPWFGILVLNSARKVVYFFIQPKELNWILV